MAGVIESVIKSNPVGRWYIQLKDMMNPDNTHICLDIEEYAHKIEIMGEEYGGEVEVLWSAEDNVTPAQINEVRGQIMAYEAAREMEEGNPTHLADGTPNFQG